MAPWTWVSQVHTKSSTCELLEEISRQNITVYTYKGPNSKNYCLSWVFRLSSLINIWGSHSCQGLSPLLLLEPGVSLYQALDSWTLPGRNQDHSSVRDWAKGAEVVDRRGWKGRSLRPSTSVCLYKWSVHNHCPYLTSLQVFLKAGPIRLSLIACGWWFTSKVLNGQVLKYYCLLTDLHLDQSDQGPHLWKPQPAERLTS